MNKKDVITKKDVLHVAKLSRIHLKEDEAQALASDLENILEYVATLENLDVTNVPPTSHVLPLKNVYREDKAIVLLTQEEALSIAVEKKDGAFKVPKIIE